MSITKKQRLAMVAIVAIGLAAGGVVLAPQKHAPAGGEHEHAAGDRHGPDEHAEDAKHERTTEQSLGAREQSSSNGVPPR